ncbi:AraC family transcriptional regulator [bacterium]|nr:MAG: AraC family transcriptional regulator [bacterium]
MLDLADVANVSAPETNSAVAAALGFIEAHLAEEISASDVARAACVSHNHLCRLFHQHVHETPMEAIRRRRVERARHLLIHTTLPIKEIAVQVGIDDLQKFNKTVRLETGRSPRELRRTGAVV